MLKKLLGLCDILLIQEHWLSPQQFKDLSFNSAFLVHAVSGFSNKQLLSGRSFGGCAILWRANKFVKVEVLPVSSNRMYAIRICRNDCSLIIVNVYMPYECDDDAADEFSFQLLLLEGLINDNADSHIIVGGDFNVDFPRKWKHTDILLSFCDKLDSCAVDFHQSSEVDFTFNFNLERFSCIDHFLLSGIVWYFISEFSYLLYSFSQW